MHQPGLTDTVQNIHQNKERLKEMKVREASGYSSMGMGGFFTLFKGALNVCSIESKAAWCEHGENMV